ncbi:MAG TPA: nucleotidyltransferase family protein, partial [Candidatus Aenigmarchaeota archaeon]|nr:nucleotidyltransferase family protein [Candidatus Aenigmarchaeota archaeon]
MDFLGIMHVYGLIPAAGRGERLKPITDRIPKPLIRIRGKPLIQYAIEHLQTMGIDDIIIALNYKKDDIKAFLDSQEFDVSITYCYPDKLLGLAYTVYSARDYIDRTFVTHLCDNIFTHNCKYALNKHLRSGAEVTLVVEKGDPEGRYETIRLVGNRITDIIEKAKISYGYRGTGIYIFEPTVFEYCKKVKRSKRGELELQDAIKMMIK